MADVASSVVGIISLGLQVCQGLSWYIGHVKDEETEVSQISDRLDNLANILENLTNVLAKIESTTGSSSDTSNFLANVGIQACSTALSNIREKLQVPSGNKMQGFRKAVKYWKSRLSYPFRREDLMFLKQMVESVQLNLNTALLTFGLYVVNCFTFPSYIYRMSNTNSFFEEISKSSATQASPASYQISYNPQT